MSIYAGQSPKQLYRSFFRYLRHLPDPHVWAVLQPRFRQLLHRTSDFQPDIGNDSHSESSSQAVPRAWSPRARRNAEDELRNLHMAVSYYPHALRRLLDACYGRKGHVRWKLLRNVLASSNPPIEMQGRPALPSVLMPLAPKEPKVGTPPAARARTRIPETALQKASARAWVRQWRGVQIPIVIRGDGVPKTGWESSGLLESLRILASLDPAPVLSFGNRLPLLPTFDNLPANLQRLYPGKLRPSPVLQYPSPPTRSTRQNPKTWSSPHRFTTRALRRSYARLWASLPWVTQLDRSSDTWKACTYEVMVDPGPVDPPPLKQRRGPEEGEKTTIWPTRVEGDRTWLKGV